MARCCPPLLFGLLSIAAPSVSVAPAAPVAPEAADREEGYETERARAAARLVEAYGELALWCKRKRLYLDRDRIYEQILEYDPDHLAARQALGYKRGEDGSWIRARAYRAPRNYDPEAEQELATRRAAPRAAFRAEILRLLEEYSEELDVGRRATELERLLILDPDDVELRRLLGQVAVGEGEQRRWVLEESQRAGELRPRILALIADAREAAPAPREDSIADWEYGLGIKWTAALKNPRVRVLGSGPLSEIESVAQAVYITCDVFRALMLVEVADPHGITIYILADAGDRDRFLTRHPEIDDEQRAWLRPMVGGAIGGDFAQWDGRAARRLDGSVRQLIGRLLQLNFGITGKQGWIWEGFGLYLTYQIVGTRLTWFVRQTEYVQDEEVSLRNRLSSSGSDWLAEARIRLEGDRPPRLHRTLGRDVNTMETEDMLLAYALAAYLIEGCPERISEILGPIGRGENPMQTLERAFGMDLPAIERRLLAWLRQDS